MNEPSSPPLYPSQTPPRPPGSGNCFLKGCLVVTIVLMILGVVIGGTGYFLYRAGEPFFSHAPVPIRTFQGGEPAYAAAQAKIAQFNQTTGAGQQATLVLTADDLNAIVAYRPGNSDLRGRVFLSIVNNQIVAETSFPLNEGKATLPEQRAYFNARIVMDASYSSGEFTFLLARFETLDGHRPPSALMSFVRTYLAAINKAFNQSHRDHPDADKDLQQITEQLRTVIIKDNQIVATSVEHPTPAATPAPAATPESSPSASPVAGTPGAE